MTHEDFSRQEGIKPSSDRSFGLVIATVFLLITFWPFIRWEPARWWALAVAAVFAALALLFARKKHDSGFPHPCAPLLLGWDHPRRHRLRPPFYDKPFFKFERLLETYLCFAPRGLRSFRSS